MKKILFNLITSHIIIFNNFSINHILENLFKIIRIVLYILLYIIFLKKLIKKFIINIFYVFVQIGIGENSLGYFL